MSFWGKLGKGLLKVGKVAAPIALGATGVGLPAAMAVSGGLNALDKKVSGGSWKSALGAGALGAGMAAGSNAAGGFMGKLAGKLGAKGAAQMGANGIPSLKVTNGIPASMMGKIGQQVSMGGGRAMAPQMSTFQRIMQGIGQGARTTQDVAGAVGAMRGAMGGGGYGGYRTPPFAGGGPGIMGGMGAPYGRGRAMPRMDQRAPNLAYPIMQGRQEAIMNQPWRTPPINPDPTQQLPNIYPNNPGIGPSYMPQY